jgi:GR25 family glycosyltransferase involved in LPS biosynthesis
MRVGLIVGDPEVDDVVLKSSRSWLRDIPKSHVTGRRGDYGVLLNKGGVKQGSDRPGQYVKIYLSVYHYLRSQTHYQHMIHFDLIFPKDISYDRLMSNDINFYNFFDPIALATKDVKKGIEYEKLLRSLPSEKVYPPIHFIDVQHDKCKYYDFLKKNKIPIIPTFCLTKLQWDSAKTQTSKLALVKSLFNQSRNLKFKKTFVKPVMGTSGSHVSIYPKDNEKEPASLKRMYTYFNSVFSKNYPKVVLQDYHPEFATDSPEIRMLFIGEKYQYSIVSKGFSSDEQKTYNLYGRAEGMAALTTEGGTYTLSPDTMKRAKQLGQSVINKLQPLFNPLPKLVTRVDVGCCLNKKNMFVNEIEYAPAFFNSWFKNRDGLMNDVAMGNQIINIVNASDKMQRIMRPMKIKISNKKPSLKMFKPYLKKNKNLTKNLNKQKQSPLNPSFLKQCKIYLLGCYGSICKKNGNIMHERLQRVNKSLLDANFNMKNMKKLSIFWKDDFSKELLQKLRLQKNTTKNKNEELRLGELGNFLSHLYALTTFLKTKDPYCIIMEDDVKVKHDCFSNLLQILNKLAVKKVNTDLLWLQNNGWAEYTQKYENLPNGNDASWPAWAKGISLKSKNVMSMQKNIKVFKPNKNFIGSTACYIINRRAATSMLKRAFPILAKPTDVFMQTITDVPKGELHLSLTPAIYLDNESYDGPLMMSDTDGTLIQTDTK